MTIRVYSPLHVVRHGQFCSIYKKGYFWCRLPYTSAISCIGRYCQEYTLEDCRSRSLYRVWQTTFGWGRSIIAENVDEDVISGIRRFNK